MKLDQSLIAPLICFVVLAFASIIVFMVIPAKFIWFPVAGVSIGVIGSIVIGLIQMVRNKQ